MQHNQEPSQRQWESIQPNIAYVSNIHMGLLLLVLGAGFSSSKTSTSAVDAVAIASDSLQQVMEAQSDGQGLKAILIHNIWPPRGPTFPAFTHPEDGFLVIH